MLYIKNSNVLKHLTELTFQCDKTEKEASLIIRILPRLNQMQGQHEKESLQTLKPA